MGSLSLVADLSANKLLIESALLCLCGYEFLFFIIAVCCAIIADLRGDLAPFLKDHDCTHSVLNCLVACCECAALPYFPHDLFDVTFVQSQLSPYFYGREARANAESKEKWITLKYQSCRLLFSFCFFLFFLLLNDARCFFNE